MNSVKKELSYLIVTTELSLPSFCLWAESDRCWPLNELRLADRRPTRHTLQWLSSCSSHMSKFFPLPHPSNTLPGSTFNNANCQLYMQSVHGLQQIGLHASFLNVRFPPWKLCMTRKDGWWQMQRNLRPMRQLSAALCHPRSLYLFSLFSLLPTSCFPPLPCSFHPYLSHSSFFL